MSKIFVDETIDFPLDELKAVNPVFVDTLVCFGGEVKRKLSASALADAVKKNKDAKIYQLSCDEIVEIFEPTLKSGENVLYIACSANFSSAYKNFKEAEEKLKQLYPNQTITEVEANTFSLPAGYLAYFAHRMLNEGVSDAEIKRILDGHKCKKYLLLVLDDISMLKNHKMLNFEVLSGGQSLNVNQILFVDKRGKFVKHSQVVGDKRAIKTVTSMIQELGRNIADHRIGIVYSEAENIALSLKEELSKLFDTDKLDLVKTNKIVGSFIGKGFVGISFNGKIR